MKSFDSVTCLFCNRTAVLLLRSSSSRDEHLSQNRNNVFVDLSLWTEWSKCSLTCGLGEQTRTRKCEQNCNGISSDHLSETKSCIDANCPGETSQLIKTQNNVFLDFSLWSEWSKCSRTCGLGEKTRRRQCKENCDGISSDHLSETIICNNVNCPGEISCRFQAQTNAGSTKYYREDIFLLAKMEKIFFAILSLRNIFSANIFSFSIIYF